MMVEDVHLWGLGLGMRPAKARTRILRCKMLPRTRWADNVGRQMKHDYEKEW